MKITLEVDEYTYQTMKIEAERKKMTIEELCLSFFDNGCNAPNDHGEAEEKRMNGE